MLFPWRELLSEVVLSINDKTGTKRTDSFFSPHHEGGTKATGFQGIAEIHLHLFTELRSAVELRGERGP